VSDAKRTIEHPINYGLANRAHLTKITGDIAPIVIPDILDALFNKSTVWAVRDYLKEIGEYHNYLEI